jgi:hypothetical protein
MDTVPPATRRPVNPQYTDYQRPAGTARGDKDNTVSESFIEREQDRLTDPRVDKNTPPKPTATAGFFTLKKERRLAQPFRSAVSSRGGNASFATSAFGAARGMRVASASSYALWQLAWHTWFWLTVQLPLAITMILFIGLEIAAEGTLVGRIVRGIASAVSTVVSFFGFNLGIFSPLNMSMLFFALLYGLGLLGVMFTMLLYSIRGESPLGGEHSVGKYCALLGCWIGYAVPFLNLFPWVYGYLYVMWKADSRL